MDLSHITTISIVAKKSIQDTDLITVLNSLENHLDYQKRELQASVLRVIERLVQRSKPSQAHLFNSFLNKCVLRIHHRSPFSILSSRIINFFSTFPAFSTFFESISPSFLINCYINSSVSVRNNLDFLFNLLPSFKSFEIYSTLFSNLLIDDIFISNAAHCLLKKFDQSFLIREISSIFEINSDFLNSCLLLILNHFVRNIPKFSNFQQKYSPFVVSLIFKNSSLLNFSSEFLIDLLDFIKPLTIRCLSQFSEYKFNSIKIENFEPIIGLSPSICWNLLTYFVEGLSSLIGQSFSDNFDLVQNFLSILIDCSLITYHNGFSDCIASSVSTILDSLDQSSTQSIISDLLMTCLITDGSHAKRTGNLARLVTICLKKSNDVMRLTFFDSIISEINQFIGQEDHSYTSSAQISKLIMILSFMITDSNLYSQFPVLTKFSEKFNFISDLFLIAQGLAFGYILSNSLFYLISKIKIRINSVLGNNRNISPKIPKVLKSPFKSIIFDLLKSTSKDALFSGICLISELNHDSNLTVCDCPTKISESCISCNIVLISNICIENFNNPDAHLRFSAAEALFVAKGTTLITHFQSKFDCLSSNELFSVLIYFLACLKSNLVQNEHASIFFDCLKSLKNKNLPQLVHDIIDQINEFNQSNLIEQSKIVTQTIDDFISQNSRLNVLLDSGLEILKQFLPQLNLFDDQNHFDWLVSILTQSRHLIVEIDGDPFAFDYLKFLELLKPLNLLSINNVAFNQILIDLWSFLLVLTCTQHPGIFAVHYYLQIDSKSLKEIIDFFITNFDYIAPKVVGNLVEIFGNSNTICDYLLLEQFIKVIQERNCFYLFKNLNFNYLESLVVEDYQKQFLLEIKQNLDYFLFLYCIC
ncbi:hypothetical protein RCL1_003855 [Eukaryota sp. TZLM3-RCL]